MDVMKDPAQEMTHEASSHMITYIVNHCKISNIIMTIIDTFSPAIDV